MKATAIAHPIQGLVKYHGLRDAELRLPLHDSISVCVAPYETRTTVALSTDVPKDVFEIDGQEVTGRAYERAQLIVDHLRNLNGRAERVVMRSENNFQSNIGLGASSSGFCRADGGPAHAAFEMQLSRRELTTIARLGAGSASWAVAGGYAYWYASEKHNDSFAERIATGDDLPMGIVMAIIPALKSTEDAHAEVMSSPYLACRTAFAKSIVDEVRNAILDGDLITVLQYAERDSLALHAVTMTGDHNIIYWQPETLAVFHEVRQMREEGLQCYFSVDTGATVYINTTPKNRKKVARCIANLGLEVAVGEVGGAARLARKHLF